MPTGKIMGFRTFDRVSYRGETYFIKGKMSKGYAILMDLRFQKVKLLPIPKFELMRREAARNSWIIAPAIMAKL